MNKDRLKVTIMKRKILYISLILLFSICSIQAQVTIGSSAEPRKGSLLDLKENDNEGKDATADKGLGLPRVNLTSLTKLTVDEDANAMDYVGLMVYNISNNADIKEGAYIWDGYIWKQAVTVDNTGTAGHYLKSNGDGTYNWSIVSLPEYAYFKPTQISTLKAYNAPQNTYFKYADVTNARSPGNPDGNAYIPLPGLFNDNFIYKDTLDVQTDHVGKYMLLAATISTNKATRNNKVLNMSFWETVLIEVQIDNIPIKEYERIISRPNNGSPQIFIDLFSVIPLPNLSEGEHELKIRLAIVEHAYENNAGGNNGHFNRSETNFLNTRMVDIGFVLYEYD